MTAAQPPSAVPRRVLGPEGTGVFASASDHHIWDVPFDGAPIRRVTSEDGAWDFLHGAT